MDIASIIFWPVVASLVFYITSIYNHPLRLKHNVSMARSNIGVLQYRQVFQADAVYHGFNDGRAHICLFHCHPAVALG